MNDRLWRSAATRTLLAAAIALAFGVAIVVVTDGGDDEPAPVEPPTGDEPAGDPDGDDAPEGRGWGALASSPLERTEVGAARIGEEIYVVGGFTESGETTGDVARYDIEGDAWEGVAALPIAVNHAGVTALDGRLYVLGGAWPDGGPEARSSRLYRYDLERDRWERLADAPTARSALAFAPVGDELYAAGGATEDDPELRDLEIYDPEVDHWRTGPPMPTGRNHVAAAVVDGRLYVIGGRPGPENGNLRTVESFSPGDGWRPEPPLATARSGHAAAAVGDRIVTFGGEELSEGGTTIAPVEVLDPGADAWGGLPDMVTPRHGLGAASLGDRVFALEGGPQPGLTVSASLELLDLS